MPAPYNYSLGNIPNPADTFMQGLQQGQAQQQAEALRMQQQRQIEAQQQMQAELAAASSDPRKIPGIMVRYPQLADKLKLGFEAMSADEQRGQLQHGAEVASALASGRPDVAIKALRTRAEALRASGDEQGAAAAEASATWAETDPTSLLSSTVVAMNAIPGGDKVSEGILKLFDEKRKAELQPSVVAKAGADATTAQVKAKYAESDALMDLEKKGWDIKAAQADIDFKRQSARIAAMNAAASREGNDLKRQELQLKIDEAVSAREGRVREKAAAAESAAGNIDNMLNTVQRVLKSPGLREVVGGIEGKDFYPTQVAAAVNLFNPLTSSGDDRADAIALIDTLGSQAFLSQIPAIKGLGQLSNIEGDKLQAAFQNLGRRQSEAQFKASLNEASRLLMKARENLAKSTGVPLPKPDTPAAPGARPPLESFER